MQDIASSEFEAQSFKSFSMPLVLTGSAAMGFIAGCSTASWQVAVESAQANREAARDAAAVLVECRRLEIGIETAVSELFDNVVSSTVKINLQNPLALRLPIYRRVGSGTG